jgi:hypothetical protein
MSNSNASTKQFHCVELLGRYCILEFKGEDRGRFEHMASIYNQDLALDILDFLNEVGPADAESGEAAAPEERAGPAAPNSLILTIADAEKKLNRTDWAVLQVIRGKMNGGDLAQVSQRDILAAAKIKHPGSVTHALDKLCGVGLIMVARPGDRSGKIATYQVATGKLLNR